MSLRGDHNVGLVENEDDDFFQVEKALFQGPIKNLW